MKIINMVRRKGGMIVGKIHGLVPVEDANSIEDLLTTLQYAPALLMEQPDAVELDCAAKVSEHA